MREIVSDAYLARRSHSEIVLSPSPHALFARLSLTTACPELIYSMSESTAHLMLMLCGRLQEDRVLREGQKIDVYAVRWSN